MQPWISYHGLCHSVNSFDSFLVTEEICNELHFTELH